MPTIHDVAKAANISATTVSLVINGRAAEKGISKATIDKVCAVMKELKYSPNLSARRLRSDEKRRLTIAFYWPFDFRANIMGTLLCALQTSISVANYDWELIVKPFVHNNIKDSAGDIIRNSYDGVIIGALGAEDMAYLESLAPVVPVVLLNRFSERYSCVTVSNEQIGTTAAKLIRQKGYTEALVVQASRDYLQTSARIRTILQACKEHGIQVKPDTVFTVQDSLAGGYNAGTRYCSIRNRPKMILAGSDWIAQGMLRALNANGLHWGTDYELLAIGTQSKEMMEYLYPSVSTITMPAQSMADKVVELLHKSISDKTADMTQISLPPKLHIRESFCPVSLELE